MVKVRFEKRKSKALTSSALRCLARIPTVNITSGCANRCIYCYSQGYSHYPGSQSIVLFDNIAQKVSEELLRKRKKPESVYFCPSCDPFQQIPEVLNESYKTMEVLLAHGVGVQFVTKMAIPEGFLKLFAKHPKKVSGQVGLITTDDTLRHIFEPNTATVTERLDCISKLLDIGIELSVRADPLIPGVTDSQNQLHDLIGKISDIGIKEMAVSYLFLRVAIKASLKRHLKDQNLLERILTAYDNGQMLSIAAKNSRTLSLPKAFRVEAFDRIKKIAADYGVSILTCGCKNPDITDESCNITRLKQNTEAKLFD